MERSASTKPPMKLASIGSDGQPLLKMEKHTASTAKLEPTN
jgi:hypothetical protein